MYKIKIPKIFSPFKTELIRIGKNNDGGYLINLNDVKKTKTLISLGIGSDWSFENEFYNLNNCNIVAVDKNAGWSSENFFNSEEKKLIRKNVDTSTTEDTISVEEILQYDDIFLKCDIEGSEYKLFDTIINHSKKFTGIVIEVHDIHDSEKFNDLTNFISKLKQKLIHIHINNNTFIVTQNQEYIPMVVELSFSSCENIYFDSNIKLPHHLDMPNEPSRPDFQISF